MATIRKVGDKYRAEVWVKKHRESRRFYNKMAAREWAADRERQLRDGVQPNDHTLQDAMERYAAEVSPKHKGEHWEKIRLKKTGRDKIASYPLVSRSSDHLGAWRNRMLKTLSAGSEARNGANTNKIPLSLMKI